LGNNFIRFQKYVKSIKKLCELVEKISCGDLTSTVEIDSEDEIGF